MVNLFVLLLHVLGGVGMVDAEFKVFWIRYPLMPPTFLVLELQIRIIIIWRCFGIWPRVPQMSFLRVWMQLSHKE